ncbi:hypothetical protein JNUCC0626_04880 [Lentzea sp. JNUCC 0626]|uniref:hypothetical protein n=1 Tax=Lentzea sp. JNUCC 0626 TaxID=3367513 RepID=UPI00374A311F
MRSRALLPCVLALAALLVAPQASAAACQYVKQDLPVPAGLSMLYLNGSSTNNSRIVGQLMQGQYGRGALWVNSTLRQMTPPASALDHTIPMAVNNTSVVAGFEQFDNGPNGRTHKAFRYENGVYEFLQTDPGRSSEAHAINDAGDVVGTQGGDVYLWPRGGPRKLISGGGTPLGVNAQRKIVVQFPTSRTVVFDGNGGPAVEIPGYSSAVTFDNDRVLRREQGGFVEWDLDGVQVATHPGGVTPFGRNGSGTVYGTYYDANAQERLALWRKTGRTDVVADPMPIAITSADVTDAATLIGVYRSPEQLTRPARWLWTCA